MNISTVENPRIKFLKQHLVNNELQEKPESLKQIYVKSKKSIKVDLEELLKPMLRDHTVQIQEVILVCRHGNSTLNDCLVSYHTMLSPQEIENQKILLYISPKVDRESIDNLPDSGVELIWMYIPLSLEKSYLIYSLDGMPSFEHICLEGRIFDGFPVMDYQGFDLSLNGDVLEFTEPVVPQSKDPTSLLFKCHEATIAPQALERTFFGLGRVQRSVLWDGNACNYARLREFGNIYTT